MRSIDRKSMLLGAAAGLALSAGGAILMGQGGINDQPSTPNKTYQPSNPGRTDHDVRMGSEYFVTGEGNKAHLWMRDGTTLRWVASSDTMNRMPDDRRDTRTPTTPSTPTNPDKPK